MPMPMPMAMHGIGMEQQEEQQQQQQEQEEEHLSSGPGTQWQVALRTCARQGLCAKFFGAQAKVRKVLR